eukprot:6998010-Prymnesium_polylepis.1
MENVLFQSPTPCLTKQAPVFSGCYVLASRPGMEGVSLYQIITIARLQSPYCPNVVAYSIRYDHSPNPGVSGLFGTFRRTTGQDATDQ